MIQEFVVPEKLWCADISGYEHHFDEGTFKELIAWLDGVAEAINESGDKHRFVRFTTEDIYGEEISFCWADVRLTYISDPETRRKARISGEARKKERLEQGFREDDE